MLPTLFDIKRRTKNFGMGLQVCRKDRKDKIIDLQVAKHALHIPDLVSTPQCNGIFVIIRNQQFH